MPQGSVIDPILISKTDIKLKSLTVNSNNNTLPSVAKTIGKIHLLNNY